MLLIELWLILITIDKISDAVSFNQPKFCPNASWHPNATTFADKNTIGSRPWKVFITTNNTIYVPNRETMHIMIWSETSSVPTRNISLTSSATESVFITEEGDVYFDYKWNSNSGIGKLTSNLSSDLSVMEVCPRCYDIFIDIRNNIYCSMDSHHQVVRKSLNDGSGRVEIAAGTGIAGSTAYMLNSANGIFVDTNFDLYVADHRNNRVQLFPLGQTNGITVTGDGSLTPTIILYGPSGIVLDANKYLFIVDMGYDRIVGSGPNGFRCLVGCNGSRSLFDKLSGLRSMSFDKFGNIFAVDEVNNRVQKFILVANSCNETIMSTANTAINSSANLSTLVTVNKLNGISYNQPKFDPLTVWNPNGITFADNSTIGLNPSGIFINKNNTIYVPGRYNSRIQIWTNDRIDPTTTIYTSPLNQDSIFVTSSGDIYTDTRSSPFQISKWTSNTNDSHVVAYADGQSYGVFVDLNNTLYFSVRDQHKVVARSLSSTSNILTIVAGTCCSGNATNMLNKPHGIFVDVNFDLYVADSLNNRIQLFRSGMLDAITVTGSRSAKITITLNYPTSIVLDGDKYLFIVEFYNHRVVGSGPYGFRCIVGCTGSSGSTSSMFDRPISMAFDSHGNIYSDEYNHRIKKFLRLNNTLTPSYNQPKICSNATWNPNAATFADYNTIGSRPFTLFINTNNTIYAKNYDKDQILMWFSDSNHPSTILYTNLSSPFSMFVTINGDIYADNLNSVNRFARSISYTNIRIPVMNIPSSCMGLFVDVSNTLYCSVDNAHQVFKKWLGDNITTVTTVAGNGTAGSALNMLYHPNGIFVDTNFDLYVADWSNHRIQLFGLGQLNGITVAGGALTNITINLNCPVDVILDGNKYLFISDWNSHRIIGSDENGFRCIVGCSGSSGSTADKLNVPRSIAFDIFGNLYVVDNQNNRIQKFTLLSSLCNDETTTSAPRETCDIPIVTLIPDRSTLLSPLEFFRSQDFSIISEIELDCNESLSFVFQWFIKTCTISCLNLIQLDKTIRTTFTELFIPARILAYGIYEIQFQVTIIGVSQSTISRYAYIRIIPSDVMPQLLHLGTSIITIGHEQDLKLDPGMYSIDPDENSFNHTNWMYKYYYRIYDSFNRTEWKFENSTNSSLTILSGSLQLNQTYEFMVHMENRLNSSRQATGYALVKIEDAYSPVITTRCVVSSMCISHLEYQQINPTTQVALFSICNGNCTMIQNITWNIYAGIIHSPFNQMNFLENSWFFGQNTSNFTATTELFMAYPQIKLWRFEVVYSFPSTTSISALHFIVNEQPMHGLCSISPQDGTTSSLFTISCADWFDKDGIKDYSFYAWTTDRLQRIMIAFSSVSTLRVRLPAGNHPTFTVHLMVYIRDQLNCVTEYNMSSVIVLPDSEAINNLISSSQNNPIVQLLAKENQNSVGQVISSVSQEFNRMNMESISKAVENGISAGSISISLLRSQHFSSIGQFNQSTSIEFNEKLNSLANIREYLMKYVTNLPITTLNSIKLQSSTLVQLTKATNQLTRTTLTLASNKCYQLTLALSLMPTRAAYEDIQIATTQLIQCASNILNAVNGPLQERTNVLDLDAIRAASFSEDYETSFDSTKSSDKNLYDQQKLANQIQNEVNEIVSKLTSILKIHLNIGQQSIINTSEVFMSLETQSIQSLSNKQLNHVGIRLPSMFQTDAELNTIVSIRSIIQPLAPHGNSTLSSMTNSSRSISFSMIDQNGDEISIKTNDSHPIEIIIPRDPNLIIPPMILYNVTSSNFTSIHHLNISSIHSISVHFQLEIFNRNLAYLFIYKFDHKSSSFNDRIDGWILLCPFNLTNESIYQYYLDNQLTNGHRLLIFNIRELNSTELLNYCFNLIRINPLSINENANFTSNYGLRIYASACYYLDENNEWKSDGLRVGPRTNHYQTQCFSTGV